MALIREALEEIAGGWSTYKDLQTVDSSKPIHELVVETLPNILLSKLKDSSYIKVQGSTGLGNITAAPWVATFDTRITRSAAQGYYVVYLYSVDMQSLFLCFGLGATQFNEAFTRKADVYAAMEAARERLFEVVVRHLPNRLNNRLEAGDIDLGATTSNKLHRDYERGNVFSLKYELKNLPSEEELIEDYGAIVSFMRRVVEDPLTPDPLALLKGTTDLASRELKLVSLDFEPRKAKSSGSTGGYGSGYSKNAKIIGDQGELVVLEFERNALRALGRNDLAEKVVHEEAIGNRPGWDITSYDEAGDKKLIEVKSTQSKTMNSLEITRNEWEAARNHRDSYHLYLVTNVLSPKPTIEVLRNPVDYVDSSKLILEPLRFQLDLRSTD
ncbi:MAG: DUF3578 domain-containing protein [Pseudomonadales bacterium]|nr:DUF3578 domain-containing protein [Pseudomonadales bacterium]MBO7005050.1 DUF3578 domain-containing protein [Pseudomonadales bacterium]